MALNEDQGLKHQEMSAMGTLPSPKGESTIRMNENSSSSSDVPPTPQPLATEKVVDAPPEGKLEIMFEKLSENPKKYYCMACGSYCGVFGIVFLLIILLGSDFFPFASDVPLYILSHVTRQRSDAIREGKNIADFNLRMPPVQLERSVESLGGEREDLTLEIIYIPKYGDALDLDVLKSIFDMERRITEQPEFEKYCLVEYSDADIQVQESGDKDAILEINRQGRSCSIQQTISWACDTTNGHSCDKLLSDPVGLLNCPKVNGTCSRDEMVFDDAFKSEKVNTYAKSIPDPVTPAGIRSLDFLTLVDSAFGPGNSRAVAVRTIFKFGVPIAGYATSIEDPKGQSNKIADWLFDTYSSWLLDDQINNKEVEYVFGGHNLMSLYLNTVLVQDGMFAVASMLFVLLYIAFMTSSWWLAFMGMGQIILSMGPAYLIYFGIFQQRYFGVFNMLSVFIILGIGADDIFVFLDTWEQSSHTMASPAKRMAWTWKHAGKAMMITSLTTIISFVANASSSFPAIQTFGIFAAMLVLVNYCAVMIYFPTVVMVHHKFFEDKKFCCGVPEKVGHAINKGLNLNTVSFNDFVTKKDENGNEVLIYEPPKESAVNHWFRHSFSSGVIAAKVIIVIIFAVLLSVMIINTVKVEPDPNPGQFLPSSNNYQKFFDVKPKYFSRGGSIDSVEIMLAWGFNIDDPIDRSGTQPTDFEDPGKPVWDPNFNLPIASECIHQISQNAQAKSDHLKTGGYPDYAIDSPISAFRTWVVNNTSPNMGLQRWNKITGLNADEVDYYSLLGDWASNPKIVGKWKPFIYAQRSENISDTGGVLRFVTAELKLTVTGTLEVDEGTDLWERWEDFMIKEYTKGVCKEVAVHARGFQSSLEFMYVRKILVDEAFSGIRLSLSLALVILMLATGNVLIAFYATMTITFIVISTLGTTVLIGWKLGVLESIGLVMVPGLSVDFVAHFAEAYVDSSSEHRHDRVRDMLGRVAISVVSGAFSTLGASLFLFFPIIIFFNRFGTMIFMTIGFSLLWSLIFFPAFLSTPLGPSGFTGNWVYFLKRMKAKYVEKKE